MVRSFCVVPFYNVCSIGDALMIVVKCTWCVWWLFVYRLSDIKTTQEIGSHAFRCFSHSRPNWPCPQIILLLDFTPFKHFFQIKCQKQINIRGESDTSINFRPCWIPGYWSSEFLRVYFFLLTIKVLEFLYLFPFSHTGRLLNWFHRYVCKGVGAEPTDWEWVM